jgi:hypothetical protein
MTKSLEGPQWAGGCTEMQVHLKVMLLPASFKTSSKFQLESYTYSMIWKLRAFQHDANSDMREIQ